MKTLREVKEEDAQRGASGAARDQAERNALVATARAANHPVYADTTLNVFGEQIDRSDYHAARETTQQLLLTGSLRVLLVACDHCGTALCTPDDCLLSNPAQQTVRCAGCGFITYVRFGSV